MTQTTVPTDVSCHVFRPISYKCDSNQFSIDGTCGNMGFDTIATVEQIMAHNSVYKELCGD